MEMERGSTRIYNCPMCEVDTPHTICNHKGDMYAVMCSNCSGGSLVRADELRLYQVKWEEELRQILDNLNDPEEGDD